MTDYYIPWGGRLPRLFIDENGKPLSGATLAAYKARTTTPINMYDGIAGDVIGSEVVVSGDGGSAGYIERDSVDLTAADTQVAVSADAPTVTAEIDGAGDAKGVYFSYRSFTAYLNDLSTLLWEKDFGETGFGITQVAVACSKGYVYTANANENLYRWTPNGNLDWTYSFTSQLDSIRHELAADPDGNAYIRQGGDLLKISAAGSLVWTYSSGVGGGSVVVNDTGNCWITTDDGASTRELHRVDSDGNQVWAVNLPASNRQVTLDPSLNSYVAGSTFIRSFDSSGSQRWSVSTSSSGKRGACVSPDGAHLFVQFSNGNLIKYDTTDGSALATYTDATGNAPDDIAVGGDGFLYILVQDDPASNNSIGRKIDPSDMSVVTSVTLTDVGGTQIAADPGHQPAFF